MKWEGEKEFGRGQKIILTGVGDGDVVAGAAAGGGVLLGGGGVLLGGGGGGVELEVEDEEDDDAGARVCVFGSLPSTPTQYCFPARRFWQSGDRSGFMV